MDQSSTVFISICYNTLGLHSYTLNFEYWHRNLRIIVINLLYQTTEIETGNSTQKKWIETELKLGTLNRREI